VIELLRRNPLIAALAALCVVLAAVVTLEVATLGSPDAPPAARKVAASEAKLLPPVAAVSAEAAYPETAARPLWIPTRRPAPPAAVAQASFQRGQFVLQGVTIAGNTRIAMLKEKASGRVHRVEQGRDINGLQLTEIEPGKVTLAQGGEREVLELLVQRPGGPAPKPGQPGAAPPPPQAASTAGPFAGAQPTTPRPVAPRPAGVPALIPPGPMPPSFGGPAQASNPAAANPSPGTVPQQTSAPMTPEELLARRRARRNPSP
jgi:hypothetical protein